MTFVVSSPWPFSGSRRSTGCRASDSPILQEEGEVMSEPLVVPGAEQRTAQQPPIVIEGHSFGLYEWQGSGPATLHVHHADDEAWYVLGGTLHFRFADRESEA